MATIDTQQLKFYKTDFLKKMKENFRKLQPALTEQKDIVGELKTHWKASTVERQKPSKKQFAWNGSKMQKSFK